MSTTTTEPVRHTLDLSGTERVPMSTLVGVELRKTFDTRAGRWFTVSIVGLMLVGAVLAATAFPEESQTYIEILSLCGGILGYFLPILVILLVTSEWTQRTGLTTFALEPRRPRIVGAKLLAGLVLAVSAFAIAAVVAAVGTLASPVNGGEVNWDASWGQLQSFLVTGLIGVLIGFMLATLLRNSAAAIVAYFVYTFALPTVVGILAFFIDWFEPIAPWVEFNTAQTPLITGNYQATGEEWAQIAVSGTLWLIIPMAFGIWRIMRAEVK